MSFVYLTCAAGSVDRLLLAMYESIAACTGGGGGGGRVGGASDQPLLPPLPAPGSNRTGTCSPCAGPPGAWSPRSGSAPPWSCAVPPVAACASSIPPHEQAQAGQVG